jgi:hypothetical protein
MHYSEMHSAFESSFERGGHGDPDVVRVHLQGYMDVGMLEDRIGELLERIETHTPSGILCDLRAVAGYGHGTQLLAREWLMIAQQAGIRRVAVVASSSVLRTAALLLARNLRLELRCFLGETEALRWLRGRN